ncbi:hypothetical protein D9M68_640830 [compost metagenome]
MLGEQARGLQRFRGGAPQARDAQLQPQRLDAAARALRQLGQTAACSLHIAVFHCPAHRAQQGTLGRIGRSLGQGWIQRGLQIFVASLAVLQRLRAFGDQQVREHLQLVAPRPLAWRDGLELIERVLRCRLRTHETARQLVRQCVHDRTHH